VEWRVELGVAFLYGKSTGTFACPSTPTEKML
jgi:hypothetical protein